MQLNCTHSVEAHMAIPIIARVCKHGAWAAIKTYLLVPLAEVFQFLHGHVRLSILPPTALQMSKRAPPLMINSSAQTSF